jgi:hypothetical protein
MSNKIEKQRNLSKENKDTLINNIKVILIYSLVVSISLAINNLVMNLYKSFQYKNQIIAQLLYIFILFGIILFITYLYNYRISKI